MKKDLTDTVFYGKIKVGSGKERINGRQSFDYARSLQVSKN